MSLFTPKWNSPDQNIRRRALKNISTSGKLFKVVQNGLYVNTVERALEKLKDFTVIEKNLDKIKSGVSLSLLILWKDSSDECRQFCLDKLKGSDQALYDLVFMEISGYNTDDETDEYRIKALKGISSPELIADIALKSWDYGSPAVEMINNFQSSDRIKYLKRVAVSCPFKNTQLAALSKISDKIALKAVYNNLKENREDLRNHINKKLNPDPEQKRIEKMKDPAELINEIKNNANTERRKLALDLLPAVYPAFIKVEVEDFDRRLNAEKILENYSNGDVLYIPNCLDKKEKIKLTKDPSKGLCTELDNNGYKYTVTENPLYEPLKDIALNDPDIHIRIAALEKLRDSDFASEMALKSSNETIRKFAVSQISDEKLIFKILETESDPYIRGDAIDNLSSKTDLFDIYQKEDDKDLRARLIRKAAGNMEWLSSSNEKGTYDQNYQLLFHAAQNDTDINNRLLAAKALDSSSIYLQIGKSAEASDEYLIVEEVVKILGLGNTNKNCLSCNNSVSVFSQKGDSCPHCGVTWGDEMKTVNQVNS